MQLADYKELVSNYPLRCNLDYSIEITTVIALPIALLLVTFLARPAFADLIRTNVNGGSSGCVSSLPAGGALWESPGHFQFAVFWDNNLTCEATIANAWAPYYRYDNFDGTNGLRIEMFQQDLHPCKKYQIDWRAVHDDGSYGPVEAVLINPVDSPECQTGGVVPGPTPPPGPVPGPGAFMLVAFGMAWLAKRRHDASAV